MQLAKLYTRLIGLISDVPIDREASLTMQGEKIGCYTNFGRPDSYLREDKSQEER